MNGIKHFLLVFCLFLSVGLSIQQPLHAGRPGEKLKEIVAWLIKNNKEYLKEVVNFLGNHKLVALMPIINSLKILCSDILVSLSRSERLLFLRNDLLI